MDTKKECIYKDQPNDAIIEMIKKFKCEICGSKSMCCDC